MDNLIVAIIVALFGLMIGSFLNVLIARYQELESIVATRSHCPRCKKQIAWYDLFPLLSFAALRARCRYCRESISWQYPVVEALTAVLAVHLWFVYGLTALAGLYFAIFALLLVVAVIDLYDYIVPEEFAWPAIVLSLIAAFSSSAAADRLPFWGVVFAGGGLLLLVLVSRGRWMGTGDIGLGVAMGLLAGWLGSVVGMILAFFSGTIVGLAAIVLKRKKLRDMVPFGPFLVASAYVATVWGNDIAMWYLELVRYY